MAAAPLVRLAAVTFAYPDTPAFVLDHLSWDMPENTAHLLLGPSGAGKSTFLRLFNGLVPHFTGGWFGGAVVVAGREAHRLGPRAMSATVGMLFQDPETSTVAPRVADDVAFALEQAGVPRPLMRRRVAAALDAVGVAHLAGREIATLSGGERQRVALAAALVRTPRLLVLDEPTSQLDPSGARRVLDAVAAARREGGFGMLLAEHRLDRVAGDANGAVFLPGDGSLVAGDTRTQLAQFAAHPAAGAAWLPPAVALGLARRWEPLPLTVAAARSFAARDGLRNLPAPPVGEAHPVGSPLIEARGVSVTHGRQTVVRGVDVALHAGEIVALVGENGSGKTSLLRALIGVQPVSAGRILVAGKDATESGVRARLALLPMGYVPQQPGSLLFADTVADEIRVTLAARKRVQVPERFGNVEGLLAAFGLAGFAGRYPRDLSVGERARLAIAVAVAADPPILLLDEPTRGLDPGAKARFAALLRGLRDAGSGVLLATHDAELVARLADRVIILDSGRVAAAGHPRAVLPGTPFAPQINHLLGGTFLTLEEVPSVQFQVPRREAGAHGDG